MTHGGLLTLKAGADIETFPEVMITLEWIKKIVPLHVRVGGFRP